MSRKIDGLFARIGKEKGFLTDEQCRVARLIQSRQDPERKLGSLFVEHGFISKGQADEILAVIMKRVDTVRRERGDFGSEPVKTEDSAECEESAPSQPVLSEALDDRIGSPEPFHVSRSETIMSIRELRDPVLFCLL